MSGPPLVATSLEHRTNRACRSPSGPSSGGTGARWFGVSCVQAVGSPMAKRKERVMPAVTVDNPLTLPRVSRPGVAWAEKISPTDSIPSRRATKARIWGEAPSSHCSSSSTQTSGRPRTGLEWDPRGTRR